MLDGAGNKQDFVHNYTLFILIADNCDGKFMLKNSGEVVY
jgi:hypothetical protein